MGSANGATPQTAAQSLERVFALADAGAEGAAPRIGIFGRGGPETFIAASGATPVYLSFGVLPDERPMDGVIERFVDPEVRVFLNRFANGDFDRLAGIVFARDDAPALTAYQYATEWVRQGRATGSPPTLFLFNLVHTDSAPVHRFNRVQLDKLRAFLASVGLDTVSEEGLATHAREAARRQAALDRVVEHADAASAMMWRNAGRFLPATAHADLLADALGAPATRGAAGIRLGLVGSPLASARAYARFASMGDIVCDLTPWGAIWPGPWEVMGTEDALLDALAADGFCPRISPPSRHRAALVEALVAARCDLVLCQLAQTDDTFGWEIPSLSRELAAQGIGFVNLGFRDAEPDTTWLENAAARIAETLEAQP